MKKILLLIIIVLTMGIASCDIKNIDKYIPEVGVDADLLRVVKKQKLALSKSEYEISIPSPGRKLLFNNNIRMEAPKPFDGNDEWQVMQSLYYEMLEAIVSQGYGRGTIINIDEFTFTEPLSYYGIDTVLNSEYFININLDGNDTLFSRFITYDDIELDKAKVINTKTVSAKFVDGALHLVRLDQVFDENEDMISMLLEDFKDGFGIYSASFGPEEMFHSSYWLGVSIREDLNVEVRLEYNAYTQTRYLYNLSYIEEDLVYDVVHAKNDLAESISGVQTAREIINKEYIHDNEFDSLLHIYNATRNFKFNNVDYNDVYSISESKILSLDMDKINPMLELYTYLHDFQLYTQYVEMYPSAKEEWDRIGDILMNYEYDGKIYKFVNYNELSDFYEYILSEEDLENLGYEMRSFMNLSRDESIYNEFFGSYFSRYNKYIDFGDEDRSVDDYMYRNETLSKLRYIFGVLDPEIFLVTDGYDITVNQDFVDTMLSNNILISGADLHQENSKYLDDIAFISENMSMMLSAFPEYYLMDENTILSLLIDDMVFVPGN